MQFVQREMVKNKMNGIHEEREEQLSEGLHKDLGNITRIIMPKIEGHVKEETRDSIQQEFNSVLQFIHKRYEDNLVKLKMENFSALLLQGIKMLPVKELLSIAESLVHIAPLKGNGHAMETAIQSADVAVITKRQWIFFGKE